MIPGPAPNGVPTPRAVSWIALTQRVWIAVLVTCGFCFEIRLGQGLAAGLDFPERLKHWAFQPVVVQPVPTVQDAAWVRNELDAFILQRLVREGLHPSPEADRATLARRLSFDLVGLPPSPEDVEAFVKDTSPHAYETFVDRLLASPHYGERWGRHWLDVVHYGESHGYDKDKPRPNAWPYRDYVIRAFNQDRPYSRFVQEQIAGDVLFPDNPEGVTALGFIAAGPWDFVGHAELPESKMDGLIARYNDRDDMVMTTMSTFLSLTVHCARCHDHKFDPITSREYYALQSVFAGVDRADRPFDVNPEIHRQRRLLTAEQRRLQERLRGLETQVGAMVHPGFADIDRRLEFQKKELAAIPTAAESPSNGYHSDIAAQRDATKWVQIDLASEHALDEIRLIPARPTDFPDTPGFGFPVRFRVEVADDDTFAHPRPVANFTRDDYPNPGAKTVVLTAHGASGRYLRITATRLWERTQDFVFALAELQALKTGNNLAQWSTVQALDSIEGGRWGKARLVDGYDSRGPIEGDATTAERIRRRKDLETEMAALRKDRRRLAEESLPAEARQDLAATKARLESLKTELATLPAPSTVYAAAAEFPAMGSFHPAGKPRTVHFLKRGSVQSPGEVMQPATLACVPGLTADLAVADPEDEGARRAALARWLTDSRNALLRRSIVNRMWQQHFGRGLVETPNDFGHMGSAPSHPELLDWLATWFQQNGESLKALHRLMVTSATYRQQSKPNAEAEKRDSDNRFLWRMNRTRLDAESLRDSLLTLSGTLNPTMGGPADRQFWFKDDHSPTYDYARFDVESPEAFRRSVYRFIVRSVPDPFMETLDCPDPSVLTGRRNTTLTPLQALSLMNHPFVVRQAELLAHRLEAATSDPTTRIDRLVRAAWGRPPTATERTALAQHAAHHGLAHTCRLVFNSNEFVFID